jgi:hypothetical protein
LVIYFPKTSLYVCLSFSPLPLFATKGKADLFKIKEKNPSRSSVEHIFAIAQITARQPRQLSRKILCVARARRKNKQTNYTSSSAWHYLPGGAPATEAPPLATVASSAIRMISISSVCCSTSSAVVAAWYIA